MKQNNKLFELLRFIALFHSVTSEALHFSCMGRNVDLGHSLSDAISSKSLFVQAVHIKTHD